MNLARRSVISISWNVVAETVGIAAGAVRTVLLARWLPVEIFGVYALVSAIVSLSGALPNFGMAGAFLHRARETQNEERAAAVHFTLKLGFTLVWATVLLIGSFVVFTGTKRIALAVVTLASVGGQLTQTPQLILTRRVEHRRLAIIQMVSSLLAMIVAVSLAWRGIELWALVSSNLISTVCSIVGLYFWNPVWKPRLAWSSSIARYFLSFGSRVFASYSLMTALDRLDDLWIGSFLGDAPLGLYSRAYSLATYPRSVLGRPVNQVANGAYCSLKTDRQRLSRSFFLINASLIRVGFLLAGALVLIAPEFIRLVLGTKWLPMLSTFRLMILFTLLEPIKQTVSMVLTASGVPQKVIQARAAQLLALGAGLFALGPRLGIDGVAITMDLMLVVGMGILFWQARDYVDFSLLRLFACPALAFTAGCAIAYVATRALSGNADWTIGGAKIATFCLVYVTSLTALEGDRFVNLFGEFRHLWTTARSTEAVG